METNHLFTYLLKSTTISGIFYLYYYVVLRNHRFHQYNRFYLLITLLLSLIFPLFSFTFFTNHEETLNNTEKVVYLISTVTIKVQQTTWIEDYGIEIICGAVSISFLGYLALKVFQVFSLKRRHSGTPQNGVLFIETEDENAPFSFLNLLFWKKSIDINSSNGQAIFKHELTHIQQKHTIDRLFCQIITSIFWMNPFTWLIQKELQNIHEFIADQEAVGNDNVEHLAQMILESQYGNHFLNPIHSFYFSSIKRRIIMLTTSKKPKHSYLRKVLALPLVAIVVLVFSIKLKAQEERRETREKGREERLEIRDERRGSIKTSRRNLPPPPTPPMSPMYVIDGQVDENNKHSSIKPEEIESMNILKGTQAKDKYGKKGASGVIEIKTKIFTSKKE